MTNNFFGLLMRREKMENMFNTWNDENKPPEED